MAMYNIEYTEDALVDLQFLRKNEQQLIINEIENQLVYGIYSQIGEYP